MAGLYGKCWNVYSRELPKMYEIKLVVSCEGHYTPSLYSFVFTLSSCCWVWDAIAIDWQLSCPENQAAYSSLWFDTQFTVVPYYYMAGIPDQMWISWRLRHEERLNLITLNFWNGWDIKSLILFIRGAMILIGNM